MRSLQPSIRAVRVRQLKSRVSYIVSWRIPKVGDYSRAFRAKAQADQLWRRLHTAAESPNTRWDPVSGLPEELRVATKETWADYMLEFIERQHELRATSVKSLFDGLAIATLELMSPKARLTVEDARAIRSFLLDALVPGGQATMDRHDHTQARRLLRMYSLPLSDLADRTVASSLVRALHLRIPEELNLATSKKRTALVKRSITKPVPKGTDEVGHNTWLRRRSAVSAVVSDAIENGMLRTNPLKSTKRAKRGSGTSRAHRVSPKEVCSRDQVRLLARAISLVGHGSGRYFALVYLLGFAGLRPSEAYHLRIRDLHLPPPDKSWGVATVCGGTTTPGRRYTGTKEVWTDEATKTAVGTTTVRDVPLLPEVVMALRLHLELFRKGAHYDDRVFVNSRGKPIYPQNFERLFRSARERIFKPTSLLYAKTTPYSLRHSSVTNLMAARVPHAENARWHGHSVDVLLAVYAGFVSDDLNDAMQRVEALMNGHQLVA